MANLVMSLHLILRAAHQLSRTPAVGTAEKHCGIVMHTASRFYR